MSDSPRAAVEFAPPPAPPAKPKRFLGWFLMLAVGMAVGLVGGGMIGRALKHAAPDALPQAGGAAGLWWWLPLAWWVTVAVHEAGHLWMGVRMGMTPVLYVAGPLRVARDGTRMRAGFNANFATWGGLAASVPHDTTRFSERMSWVVAGGPLASFAFAAVCAGVVAIVGPAFAMPAATLGLMSGAIGVATLLPSTIGGFSSDGAQLLAYRRGDAKMELRGLLLALAGAGMAGVRPRELDRALIERGLALDGTPLERLSLLSTAASAALDRGDDAAALFAEIARRWYDYPDGFRQVLALWLAWYVATARRDLGTAREWLARGKGGLVDGALRELAEAAVASLAGDGAARDAALARAAKRGPGMDVGGDKLVRDLLAATSAR
ncbi:MAG: M50 family metallopeptidase [Candidatus Eisenbacteria bacterium]